MRRVSSRIAVRTTLPQTRMEGLILWAAAGMLLILAHAAFAQSKTPDSTPPSPESKSAPEASPAPKGMRTLNIVVPEKGRYFVRLPGQLPKDFSDEKTAITFDSAALGKSPRIAVDDANSGNTAVMPIPAGDTLELRKSDFEYLHTLKVQVTYENKPVQVAHVTLVDSDKKAQTQLLDSTKQGTAIFEDVRAGKAKLTIKYGDNLTETKDIEVTTDHPAGFVVIPAAVSNKVPTLDAPTATTPSPNAGGAAGTAPGLPSAPGIAPIQPSQPAAEGGGLASLIGNLIGLAVAGGAIYLLYRWAQSGGMAATLKKAGIEVKGAPPPSDAGTPWQPNAPAPPVVADPSLCQFCGQKKDAAGNCACSLAASGVSGGAGQAVVGAASVVPSQPRLVATMGLYSGSIFPLAGNGSGLTVGRDPASGISLSNDTTVSRRHASLRLENGACLVSDEGSSNGVYVNGVKINGSQTLRPGDEVQIGNTRFRFEM